MNGNTTLDYIIRTLAKEQRDKEFKSKRFFFCNFLKIMKSVDLYVGLTQDVMLLGYLGSNSFITLAW